MIVWSRRALVACSGLWFAVVAIYVVLGLIHHGVLPSPYNLLLMLLLAVLTLGSATAWLSGWVARRALEDVRLVVLDAATAQELASDLRYTRLFGMMTIANTQISDLSQQLISVGYRLDKMDAPTVPMPRLRLVAVGRASPPPADQENDDKLPGYARGYVDGLARQPMDSDAKVIPIDRN